MKILQRARVDRRWKSEIAELCSQSMKRHDCEVPGRRSLQQRPCTSLYVHATRLWTQYRFDIILGEGGCLRRGSSEKAVRNGPRHRRQGRFQSSVSERNPPASTSSRSGRRGSYLLHLSFVERRECLLRVVDYVPTRNGEHFTLFRGWQRKSQGKAGQHNAHNGTMYPHVKLAQTCH